MTRLGWMLSLTAMILLTGARVGAQETSASASVDKTRQGFWISTGLGYGSAGLSCSGCDYSGKNGTSRYLALGGTLSPQLRLGLDVPVWTKNESGGSVSTGVVAASAYYYPSLKSNLWLKAGVGVAVSTLDGGTDGTLTSTGFGYTVGAGYDWHPVGGSFAAIPYVSWAQQVNGTADYNGSSTGQRLTGHFFQFGVGIGYKH